jgi:hemolysin III
VGVIAAEGVRPRWRGLLHRGAAIVFAPLFVLLIVLADSGSDRLAVLVYSLGVEAMLGVSAVYHSGRLGPTAERRLKRLDHSTILLAIAGSYTAVTALSLEGDAKTKMLAIVWIAAIAGITIRMAWLDAPYPLVAVVYVVVGWIALIDLPEYFDALTGAEAALVVLGGLLYTVGGVVYALHKPNPWPATFGYHEVFHALVVAGAAAHYFCVLSLVL